MKVIVSIALFFCLTMLVFAQETLTVTASKDNTLYQDPEGLLSNGAGTYLFAGRTNQAANNLRRAVVKFDLTGKLPGNATITSAKLKMNLSKNADGESNINVHKLTADWGEGTSDASANEGSGVSATTNDATWKHRFFSSQNWTTPGGDYVTQPSAANIVDVLGTCEWTDALLLNDVKAWVSAPATNFGWILIGNESVKSSKRFDSREIATAANRPQLIIQYTTSSLVKQVSSAPKLFSLEQNFPNPFNPTTTIQFSVPISGDVRLTLFDGLGKENTTLINQSMGAGTYKYELNAITMPSGIYYYRLQSAGAVIVKKLLLIK
ncbi:MAG: DNRLRE domain-containing protein [Bacteroidota bacterium]|nr:DNRLRE domain-containing protein [Bacteroidota bacterium]